MGLPNQIANEDIEPLEPALADAWDDIADAIDAVIPRLPYAEKFAPAMVSCAYRSKAAKLRR